VHSDVMASDRDGDLKGGDAEDGHAHDTRGGKFPAHEKNHRGPDTRPNHFVCVVVISRDGPADVDVFDLAGPVALITLDPFSGWMLMCVVVNGVDIRKRKRSASSSEVVLREKRGSPGKVKETPEQIQFKRLVKDIAIVLTSYMANYPMAANISADSDPSVLRYPLPAPNEISVSPNGKRTNKSESVEPVRTIASKLEANEYTNLNQLEV